MAEEYCLRWMGLADCPLNSITIEFRRGNMAYLNQMNLRMGLRYLFVFHILFIACGCTGTENRTVKEYREVKSLSYQENVSIMTEPPGCRIYINDKYIGISPVTTVLDGGTVSLREVGTFIGLIKPDYTYHWINNEKDLADFRESGGYYFEKTGEYGYRQSKTTWTNTFETVPPKQGHLLIKACKEGMDCATKQIDIGDSIFIDATAQLNPQNCPSQISAERNLLLELRPTVVQVIPFQPQISTPGTSGTNNISAEYTAAKAEYESALQAYNVAKSKVDEAQMMNSVNRIPGSTGNPLFDLAVRGLAS
jgi:hypothetical protein